MQEYLIICAFIAFVVVLIAWGLKKNHTQKKDYQELDDVPFGSVSSEKQLCELNNVYQANKVRSQRNLDG